MEFCFKCGIAGDKVHLFDAIGEVGIVKICRRCSSDEDIPIINKPTDFQLEKAERKNSIYERLSKVAGIVEHRGPNIKGLMSADDLSLKQMVNQQLREREIKKVPRPDLVDNFHWVIMRARRAKKMTQEQLGKEVGIPEAAVKLAEQGVLPDGNYSLVQKLEDALGIQLRRGELVEEMKPREVSFDSATTKVLTIADLKEMRKKREQELFEMPRPPKEDRDEFSDFGEGEEFDDEPEFVKENSAEEKSSEDKSYAGKKNLSDKEIDDILFGRKG